MICARCDRLIPAGQAKAVDVVRPTGPGGTLYVHDYLCERPLPQTSPVSRPEPTREG